MEAIAYRYKAKRISRWIGISLLIKNSYLDINVEKSSILPGWKFWTINTNGYPRASSLDKSFDLTTFYVWSPHDIMAQCFQLFHRTNYARSIRWTKKYSVTSTFQVKTIYFVIILLRSWMASRIIYLSFGYYFYRITYQTHNVLYLSVANWRFISTIAFQIFDRLLAESAYATVSLIFTDISTYICVHNWRENGKEFVLDRDRM